MKNVKVNRNFTGKYYLMPSPDVKLAYGHISCSLCEKLTLYDYMLYEYQPTVRIMRSSSDNSHFYSSASNSFRQNGSKFYLICPTCFKEYLKDFCKR